tara:strand:+ start:1327 stop:1806 length:480 start_codon:yes stop_codon:yes gene_type:complete
MEYDIIDNFLPEQEFAQIYNFVMGNRFPWFRNDGKIYDGDGHEQFFHIFYHQAYGVRTNESVIIQPVLKKLGANNVHKAKVNMTSRRLFFRKTEYHIDVSNVTTAIFYVNTNNGGTKLKRGPFVKSVANRILLFSSNIQHRGVHCSNADRRVVLNINYS